MNSDNKKSQIDRLDPFIMEYFKYLREEINLRVIKHSYLVIYKLVAIGALLAFILGVFRSPIELIDLVKNSQYLIWIVPLVCMIFDMIILGNLRVVANIGGYIKENYEEKFFNTWKKGDESLESFEFWESAGAHNKLMWKCYTPFDMTVIYSATLFLVFWPLITTIYLLHDSPLNPYYYWNILLGSSIALVSFKIYINMCKLVSGKESFLAFLRHILGPVLSRKNSTKKL
jgi:hypothetical protein